jgi:hypothetical protein
LTIVATFDDAAKAQEVAGSLAESRCRIVENHIVVTLSEVTDYEARKMRKQLRGNGATKTRTYDHQYYQEATVSVRVPLGITESTMPLIFTDEERRALRELRKYCGEPQVTTEKSEQVWTFRYMGEESFGDEKSSWTHEKYILPKGKATRFRDRVRLSDRFKLELYGLEWRHPKPEDETTDDGT